MVTRKELYDKCVEILKESGFAEDCSMEVTWIFQDVLGEKNIRSSPDEMLTTEQERKITETVVRRSQGYPLQYLLGEWEFYGLPFKVGEGVLIPRQDTETLVDIAAGKYKKTDSPTVIDLCAGSGCIGIALERQLSSPKIYAVEKYPEAAGYLAENIRLNGSRIEMTVGDVLDIRTASSLPKADLIVCNPPYLTSEDMENLQREVSFEPECALFGGEDGLDFYRAVTRIWKKNLKSGGMLMFEIGAGQEDEVMQIMIQHGFRNVRCRKDLCGVVRCVFGTMEVSCP
ncbi:MAG: peptide chain release factor N(5)-glutamine methyltransferase [Ruminococcus sp.]|nr:peptide chain release factor N(5)-glutamine methyltransferase [Ruminococcus sp.]